MKKTIVILAAFCLAAAAAHAQDPWKPYAPPCAEREDVFAFTQKPAVKLVAKDKYEITFAVKGNCDVTVGLVDKAGKVVRHLASGVIGANAPAPFQKNSLSQKIYWNGKDDLDVYVKNPSSLRVQVRLGLKPVFDRRLGGTSPYNLPGYVMGFGMGKDAVYVFSRSYSAGFQHATVRKFDLDGNYIKTLIPPPADLPEGKLGGMGFVEYEPGKKALHGANITQSIDHNACYMPVIDGQRVIDFQPVVAGKRLVFANNGHTRGSPGSFLYYIYTDGSTDVRGIQGSPLISTKLKGPSWAGGEGHHNSPRLAASPDGKKIYMLSAHARTSTHTKERPSTSIFVKPLDEDKTAEVWFGKPGKPGSDNDHLGDACGIDTDAKGRVYVTDVSNSRIQIYSPDGKYLKSIKLYTPTKLQVHKKTGAIYVQYQTRVRGKGMPRIAKLRSFDDPTEEFHLDGVSGWMGLDSYSAKPRLWVATVMPADLKARGRKRTSVTIWEEQGKKLVKIRDFEEEARKEPGWFMKWRCLGSLSGSKSICDPTREKLYYAKTHVFDLPTGKYEGYLKHPGSTDDIAFDKRGYMHSHFNPCFFMQGVGRFDPAGRKADQGNSFTYPECPYDYGIPKGRFSGVLPVKDQRGAKGFQDGLGVNMQGEVVVQTNIYYVPKMEDEAREFALQGSSATTDSGIYNEEGLSYKKFMASVAEAQKKGETVFFIKRRPGIALSGGTVWTFDRTGELRKECAVIAGDLVNGVQMDEDRCVTFVSARPRVYGNKTFLSGKGGHFGVPKSKAWPFTGTLIKTKPDAECRIFYKRSPVAMEPLPNRPPDLAAIDFPGDQKDNANTFCWIDGAEWLYAGASPIVNSGCSCPAQRHHLDWYKRTYVPEAYRHSFAVLDTNGNLVMHVGRYGNYDNAPGGPKGAKPGGTDIGMTNVRYIGGTDNYLAFEDWGERIVVLKLDYHAEETAAVNVQ
jgi:hypothetical protein